MLNRADIPTGTLPNIIDYQDPHVAQLMADGFINVEDEIILRNVYSSIRRGLPQMRTGPTRPDVICLVGSGPSLNETEDELRELLWNGAILVTLNGSYHWCRERNLKPQTQIVLDARPTNARFVTPYVPKCNYVLASQCAPEVFDAVAEYPDVWIFHGVAKAGDTATEMLNDYYGENWVAVGGGTTVASRALLLLRMSGYVRFELFGVDCCWHGTEHHALPQPENDKDSRARITVGLKGEEKRVPFYCSQSHIKQLEDFLNILHLNGKHFRLSVHGKGMLAYVIRALGSAEPDTLDITKESEG